MARRKKEREINIVHFSFFDLLFGAFGAFVFLMILHVISSLNLVDADIQKMVDETVQEKNLLKKELNQYKEKEELLVNLQQQYNHILDERKKLLSELEELSKKNTQLETGISSLKRELDSTDKYKNEIKKKEELQKKLEKEIEVLQHEKLKSEGKIADFASKFKAFNREITSLKQFKEKVQKKGDIKKALEQENEGLKKEMAKLNGLKKQLESQLRDARLKIDSLIQQEQILKNKDNLVKNLEEKNKKLRESLEQSKRQLALLKTKPLKLKTRSFPTTITGERVHLPLAVEGGSPPYTWKLKGKLPGALFFDRVKGIISGIVKREGTFNFKVEVTDARGTTVKTGKHISMTVKKYVEPKSVVSQLFLFLAIILGLYAIKKVWQMYLQKRLIEKMRRKGLAPGWVEIE